MSLFEYVTLETMPIYCEEKKEFQRKSRLLRSTKLIQWRRRARTKQISRNYQLDNFQNFIENSKLIKNELQGVRGMTVTAFFWLSYSQNAHT